MKIAFIVDAFPVLSETFVTDQIAALVREGFEVEIFAGAKSLSKVDDPVLKDLKPVEKVHLFNDKPGNPILRLLKGFCVFVGGVLKAPGMILRSLNFFKYGADALNLSLLYRTACFVKYGPFDITHCQFGTNGLVGAFLKGIGSKSKLITTFHGYDIRKGIREGGAIYADLFEKGDMFISISEYNRQKLIEFGVDPARLLTIPVGVSVCKIAFNRREPVRGGRPIRFLTVGRLVKEKGISFAIEALKGLFEERPDLKLEYTIIGGGPLEKDLFLQVARAGLEDVVSFEGPKPHRDVLEAMGKVDIFMISSLAEALPVAAMEAQASGLPVIATKVGSVYQIVEDDASGVLVPPGDSGALKNAIQYMVDNQQRWADMGSRGREIIESRYDRFSLSLEIMDLYRQLLD